MTISTGDLRQTLVDCIDKVKAGTMSASDAKAVAMLAGQITLSLQVEVNARRDEVLLGKSPVGQLLLGAGDARAPVETRTHDDVEVVEEVRAEPVENVRFKWPEVPTRRAEVD